MAREDIKPHSLATTNSETVYARGQHSSETLTGSRTSCSAAGLPLDTCCGWRRCSNASTAASCPSREQVEGSPQQHVKAHGNRVGDPVAQTANARPLKGAPPRVDNISQSRMIHLITAVVLNRYIRYYLVWCARLCTSITSNRLN